VGTTPTAAGPGGAPRISARFNKRASSTPKHGSSVHGADFPSTNNRAAGDDRRRETDPGGGADNDAPEAEDGKRPLD